MRKAILNFTILLILTNVYIAKGQETDAAKYWIFFESKQPRSLQKAPQSTLAKQFEISDKALKRRTKVRPSGKLLDKYDLPVDDGNIQNLRSIGVEPVIQSKWLNAVSAYLNTPQVAEVEKLPNIKKVRLVAKLQISPPASAQSPEFLTKTSQAYKLDYGPSLTQNELINVPAVHDFGITGEGVIIGVMDSGFKTSGHEAFLDLKLLGEFDFVNNDDITRNESGQDRSDQQNHGTEVLSVIAGFKEGEIIGTAYNASILLAKTEYVPTETAVEEDYWVSGIEWLESQGADVVSSSLGYTTFTDVSYYEPSDMDGNTAVTTIAADIAAGKGVVVVISAGNDGGSSWNIVSAPADGDSVITVGAVDSGNNLAGFSSRGPTADGRTKPDVVAMGVNTYLAYPSNSVNESLYTNANGTSFSCPAIAGVAGLVLAAHPYLTPLQVRNALRSTAGNAFLPNNNIGWGLVDAYEAILFHGPAFSTNSEINEGDNTFNITINADSKNGVAQDAVYFGYKRSSMQSFIEVQMNPGSEATSFEIALPDSVLRDTFHYYFKLTDQTGITAFHPFDAPDSFFTYSSFPSSVTDGAPHPEAFLLTQNFPNPFNPDTRILLELKQPNQTSLVIYNTLGQEIKTLEDRRLPKGRHEYTWDGTNTNGVPVVSGVYFYRLTAGKFSQVKKMVLTR